MRIAVVGGGIIGLACAWRLAGDGHAVTLVDGAPEAREASWAAAGMLAPHHEAGSLDDLWSLGVQSMRSWVDLARDVVAGDWSRFDMRRDGGLIPALDDGEAAELEAKRLALEPFLREIGQPREEHRQFRWVEGDALERLEPALDAPRALLLPGGQVDPRLAASELRAAAGTRGVELRYGVAARALERGLVVLADGSRLAVDHVVLASGAWTPALAAMTGVDLAGEPVKGQLLRLAVPDGVLARFVHSRHAYLVPRRGGGLVVGATMVRAGFDRSQDAAAIASLADSARRLLPGIADAPIVETWTGLRPRLLHGRPVIDRVRDDLTIATGHFRNGILLTPITAELVAGLVGEEPRPAASAFALPRRSG